MQAVLRLYKDVEYGAHNSQTIILLHGGGLSWWNYREVAQMIGNFAS